MKCLRWRALGVKEGETAPIEGLGVVQLHKLASNSGECRAVATPEF
jgi:hypothetical protein